MKKSRTAKKAPRDQDMLPEYNFDYSKARPNRFAKKVKPGSRAVLLDPDVAEVFATTESVNTLLRVLIGTMQRNHSH
jgi:hypothetical protein